MGSGKYVPDVLYRTDFVNCADWEGNVLSRFQGLMAGWAEEQRIGPTYWLDYHVREAKLARHIKKLEKKCGDWVTDCSLETEAKEMNKP